MSQNAANQESVVLKYTLTTKDQDFEVPGDAVPLSAGLQAGALRVWAKVTPGVPKTLRVRVRDTGEQLGDVRLWNFLGTIVAFDKGGESAVSHVWAICLSEVPTTGETVS